jgi:hypothetical protein
MKQAFYLTVILSQIFVATSYCGPMESYQNYNVILVHGAGGRYFGLDCDDDSSIKEAWTYLKPNEKPENTGQENYLNLIGGYGYPISNINPDLDLSGEGLGISIGLEKRTSSAEDMDLENNGLRHWLTEKIFDDDKSVAYLQRPFTNPANSPVNNARELGDPKWKGNNKCDVRRSLIEEAQEVRADGRTKLNNLRKSVENRDKLPPSRNILIAHSLGGVSSREYVQGNGYKNDVDKIITLDTPHEGTGALEMLLEMSDIESRLEQVGTNTASMFMATSILLAALSRDVSTATVALYSFLPALGMNAATLGLGYALIKGLDKHYQKSDSLTPYIDPSRSGGINDLKNRSYTDSLPMMRLLYGTNSMTFSDPKGDKIVSGLNSFIPKAAASFFYNIGSQSSGGGNATVNFINSMAAGTAGLLFGITTGEHGTTLIPQKSGKAENTKAFDNPRADVMKRFYDGHITKELGAVNVDKAIGNIPLTIAASAASIVAVDYVPFLPSPVAAAIKSGIAVGMCVILVSDAVFATTAGIYDLKNSHEAPLLKEQQSQWKASPNTYSKILGGQGSYEPYRMEEFLYEKPFANVRVISKYLDDWGDAGIDSLGLYVDGKPIPANFSNSNPLAFKSSGDWETFGAKKERWVKTDGVDGKVPVRHADRYALPGFMVTDFIRKYEFEIDDLMPHRLRQIRINFNFDEEIAWECDIDKSETDATACEVFMRSSGGKWRPLPNKEKHPVDKKGIFLFDADKYYSSVNGGTGLGTIQKDNQNTVILSMVNKVGLANSQRFYYLFKAAADLAEPFWPFRNIKVSKIDGFKAYLSALGYPDISAMGGKERMVGYPIPNELPIYNDMSAPSGYKEGFLLSSLSHYGNLGEGKYDWQLELETGDRSDSTKSSITQMLIPFILDKTPPEISIAKEREAINLDSAVFLARFENNAKIDESLRMAVFFLKKDGATKASFKFSNVLAPSFGISLSDFGKNVQELGGDGEYEIVAYAFDGSVGSPEQHNLLNSVADGNANTSVYDIIKNGGVEAGMNFSKASTKFIVDMQPPEIKAFSLSRVSAGREISKPGHSLKENQGELILNQDSLLKIFINISDSNGKDSAEARYSISFTDRNGGGSMQIGDTVILSKGKGQKEWLEQGNMLIPDGDYEVSVSVWDEAGNVAKTSYAKILRIDRQPPDVIEVVSSQLTYRDTLDDYSAVINFKDKSYENRFSEVKCYWRINGGGWNGTSEKLEAAEQGSLLFAMDKKIVGTANGKRRLEAGCMDWAGNFAYELDFFHVGEPSPIITSPSIGTVIEGSVLVVRGTAPKRSSDDLPASYMLEWRKAGESDWQTNGIDVGAGKRSSDSTTWLSNSIQPNFGDLGYLYTEFLEPGNDYELRLSVKDCPTCALRSDVVSFNYWSPGNWGSFLDGLIFTASGTSFVPDKDTLSLSLSAIGSIGNDFRARLYAQDSKGNALFEIPANTLSVSPFEGKPASTEGKGIWFWSEGETYNLHWNGLPAGEKIAIHYASGDIDESVCGTGCFFKDTLLDLNLDDLYKIVSIQYEMRIPKGLDKAMLFSGGSGSVQFKSKKAFWLNPGYSFKASNIDSLLIHFGSGSILDTIVGISGSGVQVNPRFYGLYYEWNGLSSSDRYPQGDSVTIYAEAIENIIGGRVFRDSVKIHVEKPDLRIASSADAHDDFYIVSYKGNDDDMTALGNKVVSYGIIGRDADVSAYIINDRGDTVKTLFANKLHTAARSDKSYSVSWNGVVDGEHLASAGNYHFYISAKEDGVSNPQLADLRLDFNVSYFPGVEIAEPGTSAASSLSLLRADSIGIDYWHYAPVPDYLVKAEASGKTLPDSLRNINVEWTASGTQNIYGFAPQRPSLAIKRQRETLPLVIVTKVKHEIAKGNCSWYTLGFAWSSNSYHFDSFYDKHTVYFKGETRKANFQFSLEKTGLDWDPTNSLTIYAFLPKYAVGKTAEQLFNSSDSNFAVWKKTLDLKGEGSYREVEYEYKKEDVGCDVKKDDDHCRYTSEDTTKGYNPNFNLFESIRFYSDKDFYHNAKDISDCIGTPTRPKNLDFTVELTIPDEYWNASYGYDNLVNRTIRLDQTNKTMYGEEGYLKQVKDSTDIKTFFDGKDWNENYTYGMLTPYEVHRIPFVSASKILSNNAFRFVDETAKARYQYPSYYHAKFYNVGSDSSIQYRAVIKSPNYSDSLRSGKDSITTPLLDHGKVDIYVSMDAQIGRQDTVSISYPAQDSVKSTCQAYSNASWLDSAASEANCQKFYNAGSKVHNAVGDFTDEQWDSAMTVKIGDRQFIANLNNSINPISPFEKFGNQSGKNSCLNSFKIKPSNYVSKDERFYVNTNCTFDKLGNVSTSSYTPKIKNVSESDISLSFNSDGTLYINAHDWKGSSVATERNYPKYDSSLTLRVDKFFNDEWIKNLKLSGAKVLYLDSSEHTHFKVDTNKTNDNIITLSAKDPPDAVRPFEFIAVKGKFPESLDWKLLYLNNGNLHTLAKNKTSEIFEWFNVNRLQGNTSILLQWGSGGIITNMRKLDLDIGSLVANLEGGKTVQSLFGEVSVTFKPGTVEDFITVRTADAKDLGYATLSGTALLGPVVEVLPSMTFTDTNALPRIKSRIAKSQLASMNLSPDRVRLYKIDTENRKFVELQKTFIGFDKEDECPPSENYAKECESYRENWSYLLITAETRTFSAFVALDTADANLLNEEPAIDTIPSQIICSLPPNTLWLGLDNGYLEMPQSCNQPAMGILQIRQGSNVVAEARQNAADTLRWDGKTGINKIAHGSYASRYIAIGTTGQEMQTLGPAIYTDTLRPVISNWSVQESTSVIDREFRIQSGVQDELSGIGSIRLNWSLGEAISGTVYLSASNDGNVDYTLRISRKQLAQCLGCKLNVSLRLEDKGHNYAAKEWQSGRLWPYPTELALWYPALEGTGKTAREYIGTGHDLDLLMPAPWLSASGIYFNDNTDKALGKGQTDLGRTGSYTLEAWVRPGRAASSGWRRILGFNSASGKNVELQVNGSDVRLLDGFESWSVPNLLPLPKTWTHLVVAVDADYAMFYADGKLAGSVAAVPSERLWSGVFSLGMESSSLSFAGHIMQVRFYKRALEADEALALFSGIDIGEGSHTEIALAGELDGKAAGMDRGFSCAVPGSSYWGTPKESSLSWRVWASQAASYKVFLYARSAQPGEKNVKAGTFGGAMLSGVVSLENVWRPVVLQGVDLPLKAGFNDLELRLPAGMDIAGIALSNNSGLQAAQISWKSENIAAASSTVVAQVRFEGDPDPSMLRPRIRLRNAGNATIYGPKVRYYFRGEDPPQVQAYKFYPQEGTLAVRQEGYNLGYAEWSFPETTALPSGQLLFWGEGPHFGLHNTNYVPWVTADDPSFVEGAASSFADAPGIVVLDADNKVLSGSCFENEEGLISTPVVQVLARDSRFGDNQASQLYIKLENIGQVPIRDYEVRYSFYVPGGIVPVLDVYDMQGLSASLKALGSGRWQAIIKGVASLGPGISWANPAQFALHLPNWQTGWNAGDDPSYEGISAEWAVAKGIEVFDAAGNRIYGREPAWTMEIANSSSSTSSSSSASSIQVRVMAKESKAHESNASAPRFYVENLGAESISEFEVRYWLSVSPGKELGYQIYNNTQFSANMVKENATLYSGRFAYTGSPLAPGAKTEWGNGLELSLFHTDWSAWDKDSDFSHKDLGLDFAEANYIAVYDNAGKLVWGAEPVIPEEINNPAIGIARLPDGLLLSLQETSNLRLDLVNAAGMPQKFLHQGVLGIGEHLIPVNWLSVDIARTYLVVRLNGHIISSQILSKL